MRILPAIMLLLLIMGFNQYSIAEDFYLDHSRNLATLRLEVDNDAIWEDDSNYTNGWSLQYHTVRYANWADTKNPDFIKWIGENFPTLNSSDSMVRNGHGLGQNMITPGDISAEEPDADDLPYAGTLTYSLNWQNFNRQRARNLQISLGVMGKESYAEEFQKFVHDELGRGEEPKGWDSQRETEPIINIGYEHPWRLAHMGDYTDDWAGQLSIIPSLSFGNLFTAAEMGLAFRFGWNMQEGFNSYAAPAGRGFFQAYNLPKPSNASPHGFEIVFGARAIYLGYSVIYDGSLITDDDRSMDRNNLIFSNGFAFFYQYYDLVSIQISILKTTDVLNADSLPTVDSGGEDTNADFSYGSMIIGIYF